jgi:hypothetical protein
MGARQKLNAAYFQGSVVVATVAGLLAQSWTIFLIALGLLVGANVYMGEIRPPKNKPFWRPEHHSRRHACLSKHKRSSGGSTGSSPSP